MTAGLMIISGLPASAAPVEPVPIVTATRLPGVASNFLEFAVYSPGPVEISKVTPDGELLGESYGVNLITPTGYTGWERRSFIWRDGKVSYLQGPGGASALGVDLNRQGAVVGGMESGDKLGTLLPLTWAPGSSQGVALPGAAVGNALGVNDVGQIAIYDWATGKTQIRGPGGHLIPVTPPAGLRAVYGQSVSLRPLNNRGQLLLDAESSTDDHTAHALVWDHGAVTDLSALDALAGRTNTYTSAINDAGQVIGFDDLGAWIWTTGNLRRLANLPGGGPATDHQSADPTAINDFGLVVGHADDNNFADGKSHAVYWDAEGRVHRLPELSTTSSGPDAVSDALGVNNRGQIVGWSGTHAVLWDHGRLIDLGKPDGAYGSRAKLISDNGTIYGTATATDSSPSNSFGFLTYGYQWKVTR
jgi:probable HAF family extracellular repeat protein